MSTNAPAVEAIQQNVNEASRLLAKRLLPAQLNVGGAEGKKNGFYFNAWITRQGLHLSAMTAQAIANELYNAVVQDVQAVVPQLIWTVPPKALVARVSQNKPTQVGDNREASTFEQKAHEGDAALKAQKIQDEAKKRCQELVERFAPINHRRGVIKFDLRDTQQAAWRKRIAEAKDFTKLETEIRQEQKAIYTQQEKAAERI